jgi:predicted kinase
MKKKGNILQNLYKGNTYPCTINWEFLETIPEIAQLAECQQNPKWHSEGTALQHTKLAVEKLYTEVFKHADDIFYELDNDDELLIVRAAVVFHDIGKGVTTSIGKDGNWHSYSHEIEGEKIARVLLWNEDIYIREMICSIIRYHMEPLRIFESKNWLYKMFEIGTRVPWKFLYFVKMADLLGSVQENGGTMVEDLMKLNFIKTTAKTLGIWNETHKNNDLHKLVKYFSTRELFPWKMPCEGKQPIAVIMIGLPGAGKNTWIEKHCNQYQEVIQISRDDIRVELGFCQPGEKYLGTDSEEKKVTEVYDEKLQFAINNKYNIILNNVHLKKKYREASVNMLRKAGYYIEYVYIEAPTLEDNYSRRNNQILPNRIKAMALSFEWPDTNEYDKLTIAKQTR